MALKAILQSLDGIPEALHEHYTQADDGRFVLSVTEVDGFVLENVTNLKSALGKERTIRENLERQVVKFKDIDPDKARDALAKLKEFTQIDPAKEADKIANTKFEAAKAQLLEKHTGEITARDERIGHLTKTVEGLMIDQVATAAVAEPETPAKRRVLSLAAGAATVHDSRDIISNIETSNGKERIETTLQIDYTFGLGLKGFTWDEANGGKSPTDSELATGSNWDKVATDIKHTAGVMAVGLAAA